MKITLDDKNEEALKTDNVTTQGASVAEESRFQWEKMKDKPLKERIGYFFTYYGVALLAVIVGIGIIISIIRAVASHKDYGFYAMLVNASALETGAISEDFAEYSDIDLNTFDCLVDTASTLSLTSLTQSDVSTSTKLAASVQARQLDVIALDSYNFEAYALNEIFIDLRDVLSADELDKYKDYLYYMDETEINRFNNTDSEVNTDKDVNVGTLSEQWEAMAYHQSPDEMESPVPVGIIIADAPVILKSEAYPSLIPVLGIVANSEKTDKGRDFINYIFDDSVDINNLLYSFE